MSVEPNAMAQKINLKEKFKQFNDFWNPKIAGELNDQLIKLVKIKDEFVWHHHEDEDELFLVIKGHMTIRLRGRDVILNEGEFVIVPAGVEHCPAAEEEAHVLLFEPKSTLNTGNVRGEKTVDKLNHI